jgi:zinc protease
MTHFTFPLPSAFAPKIRATNWLSALAGLLLAAFWQPASAVPEIQHWQTANGARVYFVRAPELPIVDLRVTFDAGSARDGDKPGLALLTNGLLAEGAGGLNADQLAEIFDNRGAEFGNGSLRDMAWVELRSLSEDTLLQPALQGLATLLGQPDFPAEAMERERQRMLAGLAHEKQRPSALASKAFYRELYGEHPYAIPSNGDENSVVALTIEDLRAFHRRYYVAANAVLVIVGALDRAVAESLAETVISRLPVGEPAPALPEAKPLDQVRTVHIPHPSSQTHILLGALGMKRGDPDYFPLYVGNHIFGGSGLVSRLMQQVREDRGLAYSVSSGFSPMRAAGPLSISLQTRNEQAGEALKVVRDALRKFIAQGPSEEELKAAKQNLTGGFPLDIDSNREIAGYLAMIGFYRLPLDYLATLMGNIESVSAAQIREAFQRRVDPDKLLLITVGQAAEDSAE